MRAFPIFEFCDDSGIFMNDHYISLNEAHEPQFFFVEKKDNSIVPHVKGGAVLFFRYRREAAQEFEQRTRTFGRFALGFFPACAKD